MNNPIRLLDLAASDAAEPPYGFGEFERRRAAARSRRRAGVWSIAASAGVLGLVAMLALVTQSPEPAAQVSNVPPARPGVSATDVPYQPALVDVGQYEVTSELEDHIALLDAQISEARVYAAPPEQLRRMEDARAQLTESLQRVSYAQTLLGLNE
jgi:hypothetical protein